jgi:hypothetical protein
MTTLKGVVLVLALLPVVVVLATAYGRRRWAAQTQALWQQLQAAQVPPRVTRYSERELDGLPPPVQRWFRATLRDGAAVIATVDIEHQGQMNLSESAEQWVPFTSQQRVVTQRPGFVWDARVRLLPGLRVHVHDAHVAGQGLLHAAVAGLLTVARQHGGGDIAHGELMRYMAEAAWYPTALLPSQGVRWQPVDEHQARATLGDGELAVTLSFSFDDQGLMTACRADGRGRSVRGRTVPTPWEGRWSDHQWHDGVRVPMAGEVAWLLPEGRRPYWRGRVTRLHHGTAP